MHSTQPVHRNGLATPPYQHTHDKLQVKQDRQMKPKKGAGAQLYSTNTRHAFINYTTQSMSSDRFQKTKNCTVLTYDVFIKMLPNAFQAIAFRRRKKLLVDVMLAKRCRNEIKWCRKHLGTIHTTKQCQKLRQTKMKV